MHIYIYMYIYIYVYTYMYIKIGEGGHACCSVSRGPARCKTPSPFRNPLKSG